MKVQELAYWITEREKIRKAKEAGQPPPWTEDSILANYRFCNVRREDDKVTRWIRQNWSVPHAGHTNMLLAMTMARMVNRIESLQLLGFPEVWDPDQFKCEASLTIMRGNKFWGNAYTISTCGRKMPKEEYVADHVLSRVYDIQLAMTKLDKPTLEYYHSMLMNSVDGLGSFLAAQVVADLKNTPLHALRSARDWWAWAAPGPGSKRGLDRFDGGRKGAFLSRLQAAACAVAQHIPAEIANAMDMQDWQNCMCEFDKYLRIQEGGHVRNRYVAATTG